MKLPNIVIVCLNANFGREVASCVAEELKINYVNCNKKLAQTISLEELLEQNFDESDMLKREKRIMKDCFNSKSSIISVSFELFKTYLGYIRGEKIYLQVPESCLGDNDKVSKLAFATRNRFLAGECNVLSLRDLDKEFAIKNIIKNFGGKI